MPLLKLSATEGEIIAHRLSVLSEAETLADVFLDWSGGDVESGSSWAAGALRSIANGELELDVGENEAEILADCLEGSTFFANLDDALDAGELSKKDLTNYRRSATTVAKKIADILGRKVESQRE